MSGKPVVYSHATKRMLRGELACDRYVAIVFRYIDMKIAAKRAAAGSAQETSR